jgi:membrane protein HdeD
MAGNNVLSGILAIILGLLIIAFPMISIFTLDIITGLGLILIGIWLLFMSFESWKSSKAVSILALILGILGIIVGIGIFGKILAFSIFIGLLIYVGGFFLIITGVVALLSGKGPGRWGGMLGIILGVIYLIIGLYALNPLYLAFLIGLFLIISGIFQIFMPAAKE